MNKRGFTIIELLVVISIIGLISSVALANLQGAKEQAKQAASKQFQSTINHTLGAETIATWEFDEGAGNVLTDTSGNTAMNGEIIGATWVPDGGITGGALSFLNVPGGAYVAGHGFPNPGANGKVTVVMWVRPANIVGVNSLLYYGDNGNGGGNCTGFEMFADGGRLWSRNNDVSKNITPNIVLSNNEWQNVAYVYDAGKVRTFLNGSQVGQVANHGTSDCAVTDTWSLGTAVTSTGGSYTPNTGRLYKGLIDKVGVYNEAYGSAEIRKMYAETKKLYADRQKLDYQSVLVSL